jgi:hypothetical protein
MTGPYHYKRAEEILAEIEATNAASEETESYCQDLWIKIFYAASGSAASPS